MMPEKNFIVLGGGPGLGFYIPGLILHKQLLRNNYFSKIYAYENLIREDKRANFITAKVSFHRNFKYALISQRLTKDVSDHLDPGLTEALFNEWDNISDKYFMVFSGFWTTILEKYIQQTSDTVQIDLCHVDAALSSSWKLVKDPLPFSRHVWFFNWEQKEISYFIDINDQEPVPYHNRKNRLLIHGGGWGIGKYKDTISLLEKSGYGMDILNYEYDDLENGSSDANRYFMIDPDWHHWLKDENGELSFPPFAEIQKGEIPEFKKDQEYPEIYDILRHNKAIISKPGAGTLLDSLSSATPLVILEPFGDYEQNNGQLWERYGLGIRFNEWAEANYSSEILEELHHNLVRIRKQTKNYLEELLCDLKLP